MAEEKTIYSLYENHPEWTKTGGLFGGTGENHTGLEAFALYLYKKKVENGGSLPIDERIINPTGFIAFLKDSENPAYLSIAEKVEHMIQSNSMTKENFLDFATAIDPLNLLENGKLVVDRYESYLHQLSPVLGGTSEGASAARTKQKQDQAGQAGVGQASKPDIEIENREDSSSSLEIGSSYRTPEKGSEIAEISKKASAEKKALAYKNAPTQTGKKPEQQEELGQEDQEDNENRGQHQDRPATSGYSRVEIANNDKPSFKISLVLDIRFNLALANDLSSSFNTGQD